MSEVEESGNSYADLYEFAPVAYITLDQQGCIQRLNLMAAEMLGRKSKSLIGQAFEPWIAPGFTNLFFDHLRHCENIESGKQGTFGPSVVTELRLLGKNDSQIWVQLSSVTSNVDSARNISHFSTTLIDVSERKKLEDNRMAMLYRESAARAEAETLNRAKDEFLITVSHELRTPIQSVLMWTQMLQSRALKMEDVRSGLAAIEQSVKTQSRLIDSLMDFSKMTLGKLDLEMKPLELGACLKTAFDSARPDADSKLLRLVIYSSATPVPVNGDQVRLQQIFGNLFSNAIKFTDVGGQIQVSVENTGNEARLTFADSGVGITKTELPYIFERFVCSADRSRRGLGLGLAITRDLVRLHGGNICATSAGNGKGSTFTVTLPLAEAV